MQKLRIFTGVDQNVLNAFLIDNACFSSLHLGFSS